jgi:BASS family bile acid:Na+ symporter
MARSDSVPEPGDTGRLDLPHDALRRIVRPCPVRSGGFGGGGVLIPLQWIGLFGLVTVFTVMLALGLMLGREQIAAALERRVVLAAVIFGVLVPIPALAVLVVMLFQPSSPVAAGIVLMAISPGSPVALRRALDAGGDPRFAPTLHLSIVMLAVLTVPLSIVILDWIFSRDLAVTPFDVGRQVFFAQLLPLAIGAALRAWKPALAQALQPRLARLGSLLLIVLTAMVLADVPSIIRHVGWMPTIAGFAMTVVALGVGAAFAGRDASARPAAAVAAGMRNPGLALLIATLNRAPPAVLEGIIGYAVGLALALLVYLQWRKRVAPG